MDLKKLMAEAQKMQKELTTKLEAFDAKEFSFDYKGLVNVKIMGSLEIKAITITDDSILGDKETLEDVITKATSDAVNSVVQGKAELTNKIAGPGLNGLM